MKSKPIRVLLYVALLTIIFILSIASKQIGNLVQEYRIKGELNVFLIEPLKFIVLAFFGSILGIDNFNQEKRKEGKWKVNILKIVVLCIPSLFIGVFYIFFWEFGGIMGWSLYLVSSNLFSFEAMQPMMKILFGFALITSFYKNESIEV